MAQAAALLDEFAAATGLTGGRAPHRYLWTDAFAVCGFLGLHQQVESPHYLQRALRLVEQVHQVLGRHRADDPRSGWISGLDEAEGAAHPTAGGLRIGKPEPERAAFEPADAQREWDRDGQYYHYLTRWMHALLRVHRTTGEPHCHQWAVELAQAAHRGFVVATGEATRMYWKVSTDLARPLVPSMGQHDPLDGRIVLETLRATVPTDSTHATSHGELLAAETDALARLCRGRSWATDDALGLGGLLTDCLRIVQLRRLGHPLDDELAGAVFADATTSMRMYRMGVRRDLLATQRLPFREIGLAIGLRAAGHIEALAEATDFPIGRGWREAAAGLIPLADEIEAFWLRPEHQAAPTWVAHADISTAMLAVALVPDAYLDL